MTWTVESLTPQSCAVEPTGEAETMLQGDSFSIYNGVGTCRFRVSMGAVSAESEICFGGTCT